MSFGQWLPFKKKYDYDKTNCTTNKKQCFFKYNFVLLVFSMYVYWKSFIW